MSSKAIYALLISAATLGSVAAHADDTVWGLEYLAKTPATASNTTRAEVKKELLQARREGLSATVNDSSYPTTAANSVKTRAQVKSELAQARAEGPLIIYQH